MAFKRYSFKTEDWILQLGRAVMNLKKEKKRSEKSSCLLTQAVI